MSIGLNPSTSIVAPIRRSINPALHLLYAALVAESWGKIARNRFASKSP
jgi:hypothetical protein